MTSRLTACFAALAAEKRAALVTFITAGGTSALNFGQDRETFLAPHLEAVHAHAMTA